ncbi:uncharacterized protein LOC127261969 [Andrographis paniculata]|uniref:uncharacterized protein LOC127261969 n=1 Tax=Andrographis paniculata TaxID=175694 RepID=UPI0021E74730|nr:uncharacterized protein LOC127261969 [Andrographis paniculata]
MIESAGHMRPGVKGPSYHELRVPLLEKGVKKTQALKEKHVIAWKQYGCSLMADGWKDKRGRHLINLLEKIEEIGKEYVVQVVTDNGANFKVAGNILEQRIPTLYWTPCAAHCFDLMLEDIGKLSVFRAKIDNARRVTTYIYKHSLYKHKDALRSLFLSEDCTASKLANTNVGRLVANTVLSSPFWTGVEYCIKVSHPLLIVLRIVDGDEKPAMPDLVVAMNEVKRKIKEDFEKKPNLLKEVMHIIDFRWEDQMEVELYGAALFLNPSKYLDLKVSDNAYARKTQAMFNDVLEKMVIDDELQTKICDQVDDYDNTRESFGKQLAIKKQKLIGGMLLEDFISSFNHLLSVQLVFVVRPPGVNAIGGHLNLFQKRREEGKNFNPLVLEEFEWDNEWVFDTNDVVHSGEDLTWSHVDEAMGASANLERRNIPTRRNIGDTSDADIDDDDLEDIPSGSGELELFDC